MAKKSNTARGGGTPLDHQTPQPGKSPIPTRLSSRLVFSLACVTIVMAIIFLYAGARWLAVVVVMNVEIPIVTAWVLSGWLLGRLVLRPFGFQSAPTSACVIATDSPKAPDTPHLSFPLLFATAAALGLGVIGLAALGLGLAGLLNRWTVLAILLIGPASHLRIAIAFLRASPQIPVAAWLAKPLRAKWLLLAAGPAIGIMITGASITPGWLWKPDDPHPYDVLEYHLQVPREWHDGGRIVGLHHNVYSYFPYGVETHYLMAMHLRGGAYAAMYQCQYFSIAWLILAAIGVYGAAVQGSRKPILGQSEVSAERNSLLACAAAVFVLIIPWSIMLGSVAYTESALALYTGLAVAWALVAFTSAIPAGPAFAIAGLLAGLACGVKYTAFPMVLVAIPIVAAIYAIITRTLRQLRRPILHFSLLGAAVASPWLIRNFAWTGNPVFPLALKQLGPGHFDSVQVERFIIAHAAPSALQSLNARLIHSLSQIFANWQYGFILWPAALAALALSFRRRSSWFLAGMLLFVLVVWIGFTHLLGRFFFLMLPVAAILLAQVPARRWAPFVATAAVLAAIFGLQQVHTRLDPLAHRARDGCIFGLDEVGLLTPIDLEDLQKPGVNVWMIGDAQSFLYAIPTPNLHYRTVFDLPGNAQNMYQAWLGIDWSNAPPGLYVIQPTEVQRLSATYHKVPNLPPDFIGPRNAASVVKR